MRKYVIILISILLLSGCSNKKAFKPVNSNATDEVKALLDFLYTIDGNYILSGHHNYPHRSTQWSDSVKQITGESPVIWGSDFSFNFGGQDPVQFRQDLIDTAKAMHAKGHIITLMWHSCFPTDCDSCTYNSIWLWQPGVAPETWDSLVTPETKLNDQWKEQVDHVAVFLKQLQDEKIPVLWRPYHEMNGIWFWWCNKKGENGYVKLWKMMYDRFVNHHKLNNLIWVWNANAPRDIPGDEAYPYADFFPGIDYVDILAADLYHNDYRQSHHDELVELGNGKLISLGEVGQLPTPEILDKQACWTWFMGWANWLNKANDPDSVKMLYNSPHVLTLDEVQRDKNGQYTAVPLNEK